MNAGALVLAAGGSRRFGADKRRYPVDGVPLLARTLQRVRAGGLACRVCLGPGDGALPLELGMPELEFVECPGASRGMGATLADGVRACGDWEALLVVLGDMAWVAPATYAALLAALAPGRIVQPEYLGEPGHPVGFGSQFFPALEALDGDIGGRAVIEGHREALLRITVDDPGIHRDLDEPPEQR